MKFFLSVALCFFVLNTSFSQCDQKISFVCKKARDFRNGNINKELPVEASFIIDSSHIELTASINGQTETVEGEILETLICDWKEFMKDGKTRYKVKMKKGDHIENSIVEIESDNAYTRISLSSDPDNGSKLQFDVSEYSLETPGIPDPKPVVNDKKVKRKKA